MTRPAGAGAEVDTGRAGRGPVRCTAAAAAALRRLAAAAYPQEGCGVLLGTVDAGGRSVVEVTAGRNLAAEDGRRDRYELDPAAIVSAERMARVRGDEVVGFWHSHPDHPARPSGFDTERAWPEYVYVIGSTTADGTGEVRAFLLDESAGVMVELDLRVDAGMPSDSA